MKKRLIIGGGLGLVVVGGVLVFFLLPMIGPFEIQIGGAKETTAAEEPETQAHPDPGIPFSLGERVVNLADLGGYRYLKTEVVLALHVPDTRISGHEPDKIHAQQEKLKSELDHLQPQIQDVLTSVLTSKTVEGVSTPSGKEELKREIAARLQPILPGQEIVGVYFAQFLIQ